MNKITIDVRMINSSGIGTYLKNVVPFIINEKFKIVFIGKRDEISDLGWDRYDNTEIRECNYKIYSLKEQLFLKRKIPKDTDLIWIPHFNAPIRLNGEVLITIHDAFHLAMPEKVGGKLKQFYAKKLYEESITNAKEIITVSNFSMNELHKYLKIDTNKRINTIYNGVSSEWFYAENKNVTNPYIIFVGNVKPHKNLGVLLEAYRKIKDEVKLDLLIVGKKEGFINGDNNLLKQQISELDDKVIFTGYVTDEEIKNYVSGADMMVFPSVYEGFGLPPLEAMACGTPTIISNAASMPEICEDASLYFDAKNPNELAEKIKKVYSNTKLRESYINKGMLQAQKYNWEKSAQEHIKLIKELIRN